MHILAMLGAALALAPGTEMKMMRADQFAIMAWGWSPEPAKTLADMKLCGINLAGMIEAQHLDLVQQAGMQAIVSDGAAHVGDAEAELPAAEVKRRVAAAVAKAKGHPAAFGYYLRDEPSAKAFAGLGRWAAAYAEADPKALAYINLFPNYASPEQQATPTYADYLERYIAAVHPKVISYDHYALMDDGTLRDGYFQNLEAVRAAGLKHNIPFWNIVLSNSHFHYAEPSPAGLRFQAYTTLAYGARGISYFTYIAPAVGNYRLAPVDQYGNRTPTWDMLRNVNLQIHTLGPTYIKLKSVGVFHEPNVPVGCQGIKSAVHVAEASGGDLLVGEFDGPNGEAAAIVVNKSLSRSTGFSIRFKRAGAVQMVSAYTGAPEAFAGENGWLAPGQGMLLFVGK